jgi:hypothetical protein
MEIHELTREFSGMAADHLALFLENLYVKFRLRDLYRENRPPDNSESAE